MTDNIFGIVCEFNPFHNGHRYLLQKAKELGAKKIVLAMSGNFVQRGEPAIFDDRKRAEWALQNGGDLVVKIPVCHCLASAQFYAQSAVFLLKSAGCTHLFFGSESGDIQALCQSAGVVDSPAFAAEFRRLTDEGLSYPRARQQALQTLGGDPEHLRGPNNILALEYIVACQKWGLIPVTVPRIGVGHHDTQTSQNIASASAIRQMIRQGNTVDAAKYMPCGDALEAHTEIDAKLLDRTLLTGVLMADDEQLNAIPFCENGLGGSLKNNLPGCSSVDELVQKCTNNRVTAARVRRALWCLLLGIKKEDITSLPMYLYTIGASPNGLELLKNTSLPVVTSLAKIKDSRLAVLEAKATDVYGACTQHILPKGQEFRKKFVIK